MSLETSVEGSPGCDRPDSWLYKDCADSTEWGLGPFALKKRVQEGCGLCLH